MKLLIILFALLLVGVHYTKAQVEEIPAEGEGDYAEGDEDFVPPEEEEVTPEVPEEVEEEEKPEPEPEDPCAGVECGYGKECAANAEGEGVCKCIQNCGHKAGYGPRFQVCTNQNETFANICDMEKEKCMCDGGEEGCVDAKHKDVELKYYGACRGPLNCPEPVLAEFPRRMRGWLRLVLVSMASHRELSRSEMMMAREAVEAELADITPVLWKFCDLDKDPSDGQISARELLPLIAQLYPLEDCADAFFKGCDTDGNKDISLNEFGKCCGLEEKNIKNRCTEIEVDEEASEGPEPGFLTDES